MYPKRKIIREFAARYGYTIGAAEELYAEICDFIAYKYEQDEPIFLDGIGVFTMREKPSVERYNFVHKKNMTYPPMRYPSFEFTQKFFHKTKKESSEA